MLRTLQERRLTVFERRYHYDLTYARDLLSVGVGSLVAFSLATGLGAVRLGLGKGPWYAAKLVAAQHEDCGPCVQLVARIARDDGLAPDQIAAVLQRRYGDAEPHLGTVTVTLRTRDCGPTRADQVTSS